MKPYEWMVKYTPQREWIEGKGIFLWLAFYTGGLGGGLYLASLFTNNISGMVVSWFIVAVLKGGFHLLYLGKPLRFWRIILKRRRRGFPGASYLSPDLLSLPPCRSSSPTCIRDLWPKYL